RQFFKLQQMASAAPSPPSESSNSSSPQLSWAQDAFCLEFALMPDLVITNLTKKFGPLTVLDNVSVTASDGQILTLLGPSGCGKSTTLWSIAGLLKPD